MSSFKKLNKADITTVPYAANKQWNLSFSCFPTSSEYITIYKGTNLTSSFSSGSDPISEGQYERLIYASINHLFYQKYTDTLNTGSLMFDINTYESASQQRPTGAYFDYNINPLLIKNFPTGANESIRVLSINRNIYGNKILPYSFILSSSAYYVTDDGYGNLYDTGSINGYVHIGNIFYAHGVAIITNPDYQSMFPFSSASCFPACHTYEVAPKPEGDLEIQWTQCDGIVTSSLYIWPDSGSICAQTGSVIRIGSNDGFITKGSSCI